MKILLLLCLSALAGCAQIVGNTPSFKYCDKVSYQRIGNQITISAECAAPIGGDLPVVLP